MNRSLFENLIQSLKEAKAIVNGEAPASRRITVTAPVGMAVAEKISTMNTEAFFRERARLSSTATGLAVLAKTHSHSSCKG